MGTSSTSFVEKSGNAEWHFTATRGWPRCFRTSRSWLPKDRCSSLIVWTQRQKRRRRRRTRRRRRRTPKSLAELQLHSLGLGSDGSYDYRVRESSVEKNVDS